MEKLLPEILGLQNNTASNLFSGIEAAEPALKFSVLVLLLKCLRFLVFGAGSDNASQCNRYKAAVMEKLRRAAEELRRRNPSSRIGRALFLFTTCVSHIFKGILERGADSNPITTTMYSISYVCSNQM